MTEPNQTPEEEQRVREFALGLLGRINQCLGLYDLPDEVISEEAQQERLAFLESIGYNDPGEVEDFEIAERMLNEQRNQTGD